MSVEIIRGAGPSGIEIAYERFGDPDAPPVLLVMGLGRQMRGWLDEFCCALVARGLRRHDRRQLLEEASRRGIAAFGSIRGGPGHPLATRLAGLIDEVVERTRG
jgi:pimeloyl-ACP methyl ester carboxylesterase